MKLLDSSDCHHDWWLFEHDGRIYELDLLRSGKYRLWVAPSGAKYRSDLSLTYSRVIDPSPRLMAAFIAMSRLLS